MDLFYAGADLVLVSAASVWEIATKVRIGKLVLPDVAFARGLSRWIAGEGYVLLAIRPDHAELAGSMAIEHHDPWDRMILAQARIEDLAIIGSDPVFAKHANDTISDRDAFDRHAVIRPRRVGIALKVRGPRGRMGGDNRAPTPQSRL